MANDLYTVADMVTNTLDISDAMVTDLLQDAPLFAALPMTESSNGTVHKYVKETGAPVVGFRAENAGRDFDHSVDSLVSVSLKILDYSWQVDKAVADASVRGREWFVSREGRRHLRAAFFKAEQQYLNGTVGDSDGFSGIANALLFGNAMTVNAGGTTADTASSVYLLRLGEDDVLGVSKGEDGIDLGETIVQNFVDGSGKNLPVYYTPGCTWVGMQVGSAYSMGRICNLTEDAGKGLTDDLVYQALENFPSGRQPTHIVANRRSVFQLRSSRTATNATGSPAPIPTEVAGIPIIMTDALSNTEALLSGS